MGDPVALSMPEGTLNVQTAGAAGPAVILLSGAGVDNARLSWKRLMPVLGRRYRVFAPDWPKQGRSRPWRGRADHACLLRCVDMIYDRFALDDAALVGLSQGGAIAPAYAIGKPERVRRLVAIAPAGILRFPPGIHQVMWLAAKLPWLTGKLARAMLSNRKMAERFVTSALFAGPSSELYDVLDDILDEVARNGAAASDWQNASIGPARMVVDLMPDLHRIRCPTLFVQGHRDRAVPTARTVLAARRVPDARLVMLPDHAHWPNRQSPERIGRLIEAFLAGLDLPEPVDVP